MNTRESNDRFGKRLFAESAFVADLLRDFVQPRLVRDLDLGSLRPMPAEFINRRGDKRLGDALWLADRPAGARALVLIEIESTNRRRIAARMMGETAMLYEALTSAARDRRGRLPALLPLVVYTGDRPWRQADDLAAELAAGDPLAEFVAGRRFETIDVGRIPLDDLPPRSRVSAFVRIHGSPSATALAAELADAFGWIGENERGLREALLDWVYAVVLPRRFPTVDRQPFEKLDEEATMLAERVKQWTEEWYQQGVEHGMERERDLLCRQAAHRFGRPFSVRLKSALADVTDPGRLDQVADLVVDCNSGDELLARLSG